MFAIAIAADAGCETPTWYPAMLDATSAIIGARGDTSADEISLLAAAQALRDYAAQHRDSFANTGEQAFALFKDAPDLGWLDSAAGAKAILRKLNLQSSAQRRDRFAIPPPGDKKVIKGYLVKVADLVDFIARYRSGATAEEDGA
jgi:hypothetical protein